MSQAFFWIERASLPQNGRVFEEVKGKLGLVVMSSASWIFIDFHRFVSAIQTLLSIFGVGSSWMHLAPTKGVETCRVSQTKTRGTDLE